MIPRSLRLECTRRWRCLFFFGLLLGSFGTAFAQSCVQPAEGIFAWWPLDETSGNLAADRSGSHPGAYVNDPSPSLGKVGGSLSFDGTNYVDVADSDAWAFGANDFTIEFWANFRAPGGGTIYHPSHIFIGNDEGPGEIPKWFFAVGGGKLEFIFDTVDHFLVFGDFSPILNQWYHLAVTRTGNEWRAFIDGVQLGSPLIDASVLSNPDAPLTIGQAEQLGFVDGLLDEVSIYNRALTQAELQAIVDAGSAGKCKDLKIQPSAGGDIGSVSVRISGSGFEEGTTVTLSRAGESDITGTSVSVQDGGTVLGATFDLEGMTRGLWDVVIDRPDGSGVTVPGGFMIEEARAPNVWADIVGLNLFRFGRPQIYHVMYGNTGNVNAELTIIWLTGVPDDADVKTDFGYHVDAVPTKIDTAAIPAVYYETGTERLFPVQILDIPPGYTGTLNIELTINSSTSFQLGTVVIP